MRSTTNKTGGFSLLELLIVVAIILIIATIAVPALLRSRQSANESHAVSNLRTVNTAEVQYISNNQGLYGDIPELISSGLLDFSYALPTSGYTFRVQLSPNSLDYTATATAYGANSGRYDYFTAPDYVLRYSTDPTRAPAGLTGEPVR
jgi:prepilin-type N-terminal cleavage/methylation domain-containing protein